MIVDQMDPKVRNWPISMTEQNVVVTKSELARRYIQKMILNGAWQPGDRVTTREVSAALNISETPTREAIHSLAAEGWLSVQSHVGAVVQGLNVDQIREISALRGLICALAIELNAPSFDADFFAKLDANIEASAKALDEMDVARNGELNAEFHKYLCGGVYSPYSYRILENMLGLMSAQRNGIEVSLERLRQALDEHRRIRDQLRAGDYAGAGETAKQHELNTGAFLIEKVRAVNKAGVD